MRVRQRSHNDDDDGDVPHKSVAHNDAPRHATAKRRRPTDGRPHLLHDILNERVSVDARAPTHRTWAGAVQCSSRRRLAARSEFGVARVLQNGRTTNTTHTHNNKKQAGEHYAHAQWVRRWRTRARVQGSTFSHLHTARQRGRNELILKCKWHRARCRCCAAVFAAFIVIVFTSEGTEPENSSGISFDRIVRCVCVCVWVSR